MDAPRFVAYLRVSTDEQGRSGLGLGAQRVAVAGDCPGWTKTGGQIWTNTRYKGAHT